MFSSAPCPKARALRPVALMRPLAGRAIHGMAAALCCARAPLLVLALLAAVDAGAQTTANTFPTRPVHLVLPYAPGASTDILGRFMGAWLATRWGQPVVVENKPGGGETIGAAQVVRSAPDGHTLLLGTSSLPVQRVLMKDVPYDPLKDLCSISMLSQNGYLVIVSSTVPVKSFDELLAYARANPGKLNYAAAGNESLLTFESFRRRFGVDIVPVGYKGGGPSFTALMAGEVQLYFGAYNQASQAEAAGRGRTLLFTGRSRHAQMPAVPTSREAGYADFEPGYFLSLHGPAGIPGPVVSRINADIGQFLVDDATRQRFQSLGWQVSHSTPEELDRAMQAANARAVDIAAKIGLKPE